MAVQQTWNTIIPFASTSFLFLPGYFVKGFFKQIVNPSML